MEPAIVVTGASSGIGRSLALVASRERVAMVLVGQSQEDLDDVVGEISATGVQSHGLATDLSNQAAGLALAAEASGTGVTVTCLNPGVVRTPFFDKCSVGGTRLVKIAPRANAPDVAEAGWRGFKAGKSVVVPRFGDRLTRAICVLLPVS